MFARIAVALALGAVLLPAGAGADEGERHYAAGARHYAGGRWQAAADEFEVLVRDFPASSHRQQAQFYLAETLVQLGRHQEARSRLQELLSAESPPKFSRPAFFRLGEAEYLAGDRSAAQATLEKFRSLYPDDELLAYALPYLGELRLAAGDALSAKELFETALDRFPSGPLAAECRFGLANSLKETGQTVEAARLYQELSGEPACPLAEDAQFRLAECRLEAGQLKQAADDLQRLLTDHPQSELAPRAALTRGQVLESLGQCDVALVMYLQVIEGHPKETEAPQAMLAAAQLYDRLQQDQAAAAMFQQLIEEHAEFAGRDAALYQWACTCRDLGRHAESDMLFLRLHREFPETSLGADATYRLAERAYRNYDYDGADQLLRELHKAPAATPALLQHGLYLQSQVAVARQQWAKVAAPLAELTGKYPDSPLRRLADYWQAEALYRQGNYEPAGKAFSRLAGQLQEQREAWMAMIPLRRAQVLARAKKWAEALDLASSIERDFPDFEQQYEADYVRGRCLAAQADFSRAREALLEVVRSPRGKDSETAAMAQWMIGETFLHQKDYQAAIQEFLQVDRCYSSPAWQAAGLYEAGKCHELLGNWAGAAESYQRLTENFPKSEYAGDATRRLKQATRQANRLK